MASRLASRPAREGDFSNIGKVGRRTGVTLPQGRVDINGIEEISGIFSSPRKPSPLKHSISVVESIEEQENVSPPTQTPQTRKSLPPRSASPRKSGISGTARRIGPVDIINQAIPILVETNNGISSPAEHNATPTIVRSSAARRTPPTVLAAPKSISKRLGSEARSATSSNATPNRVSSTGSDFGPIDDNSPIPLSPAEQVSGSPQQTRDGRHLYRAEDVFDLLATGSGRPQDAGIFDQYMEDLEVDVPPPQHDDEDADQPFDSKQLSVNRPREPTTANSRRKRKSSFLEPEVEVDPISSPAAKRAKRVSDEGARKITAPLSASKEPIARKQPKKSAAGKSRAREPTRPEPVEREISSRQQEEVNTLVEKIKARPGQKKSLYILRRETPADDGVTHTRSGRISVKPLAYWRNERCVYGGGSPSSATLQDGARFPLNSIKEIIRTEVANEKPKKKSKKGQKRANSKSKSRSASSEGPSAEESSESELETNEYGDKVDPDAEPWETENGTFKGPVQVWDTEQQAPIDQDEEIDIAYASAAIETKEVRDSTFRYAKLLSTRFFGTGVVELPPGGTKRPKNSTKMHMCFFVTTGRVTVQVGPINGPTSRFSIGKGGFWQVPRGNQYSIENEHHKTARLFFSQACEVAPLSYED